MKLAITFSLGLLALVAGQSLPKVQTTKDGALSVEQLLQNADSDWIFNDAHLNQLLNPYVVYQNREEHYQSDNNTSNAIDYLVPFNPTTSFVGVKPKLPAELLTNPQIIYHTIENLDRLYFKMHTLRASQLNQLGFRRLTNDIMKIAIAKDNLELVRPLLDRNEIRGGDQYFNNHWKVFLNHPVWWFWAENLGSSEVLQHLKGLEYSNAVLVKVIQACELLTVDCDNCLKCPRPQKEIQYRPSDLSSEEARELLQLDHLPVTPFVKNLLVVKAE
ncbi:hypothetical protein IWQ62_001864 [Dispira parvispora]|uniref:Uncharacterized protein n=1 Tax=Dispira parvispora TaxID=1520584 RepID=A0A9W8AY16_9FUNG|nr:hypothetical protein IWQ62_001864 [Dispira parvispora]